MVDDDVVTAELSDDNVTELTWDLPLVASKRAGQQGVNLLQVGTIQLQSCVERVGPVMWQLPCESVLAHSLHEVLHFASFSGLVVLFFHPYR